MLESAGGFYAVHSFHVAALLGGVPVFVLVLVDLEKADAAVWKGDDEIDERPMFAVGRWLFKAAEINTVFPGE